MGAVWLRREKARACPIHNMIFDEAAKRLAHSGDFSKDEILDALNLEAIADAIRWDYIREFLQEEHGCELVPLSSSYFKRHKKVDEEVNPSRYIATGYGKKTAGFCAVIPRTDHLVIARVKERKAKANGTAEAFKNYAKAVDKRRKLHGLEQTLSITNQKDGDNCPVCGDTP